MSTFTRDQVRRAMIADHELDAIGAALLSPEALDDVAAVVEPYHFADERCRVVFEAMLKLRQDGIEPDLERVAPMVAHHGIEVADFMTMLEAVPNAHHASLYAERVRQSWRRRELRQYIGDAMQALLHATADPDEVGGRLVSQVGNVLDGDHRDDSDGRFGYWTAKLRDAPELPHFTTGLMPLDALTGGGFSPGQFVCIGARPGVGKTSLLGGIALAAAQADVPCLFLSLEMLGLPVTRRFLSNAGLRLDDSLDMSRAASLPLFLKEAGGWSIDRIESETRRFVRRHALKVLLVDYISLVGARDERAQQRYEQVADISRSLQRLALTLGIVVVAAQQLSRDIEKRQNRLPLMSDFRESGGIEQDADILLVIERPTRVSDGDITKATLHVVKNRNAPNAEIELEYIPERTLFRFVPEAPPTWD